MECPGCRTENAPEARFCNQCGARLGVSSEAEHRQITVVFADLVGSTKLAAELGPEDWRDTVRRYQEAAGECVQHYGGAIGQYLGDGVLAYFGHPVAHEDDAERALRAGLALLARIDALNDDLVRDYGQRISARLAAHTGPVVIGEMGGHMQALGETPNVAARLQEVAPHGSLVTSAATLALVEGRFEIDALGEHELKGVRDPMAVYRVMREASSRSRRRFGARATLSPFVGRARELDSLCAAFERAVSGAGALALITGEPGIGKSRLLHELRAKLGDKSHHWLEVQASPYAQHSPFEPLRALLADAVGTNPETARARLAATGIAPAALAPALEALLAVKLDDGSLPLAPERKRAATIASLGDWLLQLSAHQPVVLVVEDLHAIDPSSVEVIERLVERGVAARVLVVVTSRSDTKAPDGWSAIATHVELGALGPADVAAMVEGASPDTAMPDDLRAQVAQRSDGNPLFVEELARALASGRPGDGATAVPAALRDPLRARLDGTGPAQTTAQLASMLGREFEYALLRAVSPLDEAELTKHLARLVDASLIVERSFAGGRSYQFRHVLLRDAAYDSILRRTRRARHADIARVLKADFAARVRARPDLLAFHYSAAGEHGKAATEWLRAAKRASDACAFREGLSLIDRGLESLRHLQEAERTATELALHIYRATAYHNLRGPSDRDALVSYQRARELAEGIHDPAGACHAMLGLHASMLLTDSTQEAAELADELLERAQHSGQAPLIGSAHVAAGVTAYARGEWPRAHEQLSEALGLRLWTAEAYVLRTTWMCGQPATALRLCEDYAKRVQAENALTRIYVLSGVSQTYLLARDCKRALAYAREAAIIARQERMELHLASALCLEGASRVGLGEPALGVEQIEAGYELVRGTSSASYLGWFAPYRAEAFFANGDIAGALALADEGLADEAARGRHVCEPELLRLKGEACELLPDRQGDAEALMLAAVRAARRQGARGWELRAVLSASRFLHQRGRDAEAYALLAPTVTSFREGDEHADPAAARRLLDQLDAARNR